MDPANETFYLTADILRREQRRVFDAIEAGQCPICNHDIAAHPLFERAGFGAPKGVCDDCKSRPLSGRDGAIYRMALFAIGREPTSPQNVAPAADQLSTKSGRGMAQVSSR